MASTILLGEMGMEISKMILSTTCGKYLLLSTTKSKQISELFQRRGFNGSTRVIGCADSDFINASIK